MNHKVYSSLGQIIVLVFLLLSNSSIRAFDDKVFNDFQWEPVTENDWNPDLDWCDDCKDAVMLFEKVIDDEKSLYFQVMNQRVYTRTRILSEKGLKESDVEFTYNPNWDRIIELQARTVLPDGSVFELSKEQILANETDIDDEGDGKKVSFSFPGADTNCIIEYCIGISQKIENKVYTYRDRPVQKDMPLLYGEYKWFFANERGPAENYVDFGQHRFLLSGT